jgi:predicted Ser/Thr protein kinase
MKDDAAGEDIRDSLSQIGQEIRDVYTRNKRVMSFSEFYAQFERKPEQFVRNSAQYLKDVFDHFGTAEVKTPRSGLRGSVTRHRLFDVPFDGGRDRLVGQEEVQGRVYRVLANFVREGAVNKLILLHGPNGSAKSTFIACLARALEYYSNLDEGALYRFNWIFPSQKLQKSGIGFGGAGYDGTPHGQGDGADASYAYLDDDMIDAKLVDELRDHPLFLIPPKRRQVLLDEKLTDKAFVQSDYIRFGQLGHKNQQIFQALLVAYKGDYLKVLRHVQVERFYLSRRYRNGTVTVEPQLAVDAHSRQLTMDRSLNALPPALQSLSLFEYSGELVDANRGMIEYADLLKRPLEAYKYLLGTVEHGEVNVDNSILFLDTIFIGSSNESHLAVFKEIPEFQSFKGRIELVRVPYILDYTIEQRIYDEQVEETHLSLSGKHVAPHTSHVAALWAVLTRMRKPLPEKYSKALADLVAKLTPIEKAELYAHGYVPEGLSPEQAKELTGNIDKIWGESDAYPNYEGRTGASPREVKTLLLNAGQNPRYACVSPLAVFEELEELVKNVTVYEFLKQEPLPGGYHENKKFIYTVRERFLDLVDEEVRSSMGLVEERQYGDLLGKYITHVSHWTKKEKLRNPTTGRLDDPDEEMMGEVEKRLGVGQRRDDFRHEVISRIGAWSIEHPGHKPDYAEVFPRHLQMLREAYFVERKKILKKTHEDILVYLAEGPEVTRHRIDRESFDRVETTLKTLKERYRYCDKCAKDAVSFLLRKRYS